MSVCNMKISKKNLLENLGVYRQKIDNKICAMVKGNAYGHGIETMCKMLKGKVDFFGVAYVDEAKIIRKFDLVTPILVVGYTDLKDVIWCDRNRVSISIDDLEIIKKLQKLDLINLHIHLKVNTGMNRYGISSLIKFKKAVKSINENKNLVLEGVFTHYFSRELKNIENQSRKFDKFLRLINCKNIIVHADNSYSVLINPKYDMQRIGFGLYGGFSQFGLKCVKTIKAKIVKIQNVKKGESVGYDANYIAKKDSKIAVASIGYADGFIRNLKGFSVGVCGKFANVVANVCMDAILIDITSIPKARVGSKVLILGEDKGIKITYDDYAEFLHTNACEVMTLLNCNRLSKK